MQVNDHEERKTQVKQKCEDSNSYNIPRSMGDVPSYGFGYGDDQVGITGENSKRKSGYIVQSTSNTSGGIISQLIKETQEQLAYHNQQVEFHQEQSQILEHKLKQLDKVYYQMKNNE